MGKWWKTFVAPYFKLKVPLNTYSPSSSEFA